MSILVVAIQAGGHLPSSWDHESYLVIDVRIYKIPLKNKATTHKAIMKAKSNLHTQNSNNNCNL